MLDLFSWGEAGWGDEFLNGLATTLKLAVAAYALGTTIGTLGALAKLSKRRWLVGAAQLYSTTFRALPDILVMLFIYFSASLILTAALKQFGIDHFVGIGPFAAGVAALGVITGAYFTEIIRGAIIAVPRGQFDAARALGLSRWQVLRLVILPQVLAIAATPMGNMWVIVLKDTALVSVIGAQDILYWGGVAGTSLRKPFTFYLAAVVLYLVLTAASGVVQAKIERRLDRFRAGAVK